MATAVSFPTAHLATTLAATKGKERMNASYTVNFPITKHLEEKAAYIFQNLDWILELPPELKRLKEAKLALPVHCTDATTGTDTPPEVFSNDAMNGSCPERIHPEDEP